MNVLRVELIREIGNVKEYKITYQEDNVVTAKVVGKTFNYDEEEIKNIPETVLNFAENWILGEL
ncbi:hypothetical protein DWZ63_10625 [Clostridium sp. AF34-13]|uniref:hypothetical protein n=1 Tax=Clostridium sp. AF34-13 TaxID=2293012 RepID=UPI000E49E1B6|nr:hypothetical protein [Clostridium sp. AF34-13]RHP24400.1 hypothetical protein DWZ63_10625 [Clostridium sp. AF34-13]